MGFQPSTVLQLDLSNHNWTSKVHSLMMTKWTCPGLTGGELHLNVLVATVNQLGGNSHVFFNFHPDPWGNDPI